MERSTGDTGVYARLSGPIYRLVDDGLAPATESQIAWLRLQGVAVPPTRREASRVIDGLVNGEEVQRAAASAHQ